jgi:erythromycin esterase
MKSYNTILICIFMMPLFCLGQNKNNAAIGLSSQWCAENVQPINLDSNDLDDLDFLKEVVGNKRIVAIGEQTHEDGATFGLRGKIIEYLIKEMGFKVILFEAGMFDLYVANEVTQASKQIDSLRNGLYGFWKNADQHDQLFTFLQEQLLTGTDIEFGGFDCKLTSAYGRKNSNYTRLLKQHVAKLDKDYSTTPAFDVYVQLWAKIEADMQKGGLASFAFKMNVVEKSTLLKQSKITQQWLSQKGEFEWAQMVKTVDESVVLYADFSLGKALFNKDWLLSLNNHRDELMAENLQYLLSTKYADKKVILFGAAYHFVRNIQTVTPRKVRGIALDRSVTTGGILYPEFHDEIYSIGFTAFDGTYGYVKKGKKGSKVKKSSEKSLSYQLANKNYEAAFVSLNKISNDSQYWFNNPVIRFLDYETDTSAPDWSAVMDAVVYIKTMTPITY